MRGIACLAAYRGGSHRRQAIHRGVIFLVRVELLQLTILVGSRAPHKVQLLLRFLVALALPFNLYHVVGLTLHGVPQLTQAGEQFDVCFSLCFRRLLLLVIC